MQDDCNKFHDSERGKPYTWVTWITPLLAKIAKCEWSAWYRSHYRYAKRVNDSGGDLEAWKSDHAEMVDARREEMELQGFTVSIEDHNAFKMFGRGGGILAGKPDIIGIKGVRALIVDEKSGEPKRSDEWQVLVYMRAFPKMAKEFALLEVEGEVEYRNGRSKTRALGAEEKSAISDVMQVVHGELAPPRSPSLFECKYCDIASCPERMEAEEKVIDAAEIF